jgi:hypothetical protein
MRNKNSYLFLYFMGVMSSAVVAQVAVETVMIPMGIVIGGMAILT